jgi:hypothetical protein
MEDRWNCPLIDNEIIEDIECLVVIDATEGHLKDNVTSEKFRNKENWKEICKSCTKHKY